MSASKSTDRWPMQITLQHETLLTRGWETERWSIKDLMPDVAERAGYSNIELTLHKDERSAYRFNLNAASPHLFVLCSEDETDNALTAIHMTASQDEAASFMDGEHQVLEIPMPAAVQCWIDSYLGIHGELIDEGKKKKRKGKGRSSER
ncbi:DUF3305 domain-containing protein [Neptunomonas antarctica]|uniref:DUF3305 domain-containing protein n=2 Tax=Neptunomonas antarctica TaxID=619304 RepID=A0A1N7NCP7_9GAMM|nr:DUF3305 domain-containing protein [Neptunomonas antarctica]SIS96173.1 Protein of unknown function [Neptunomonas antarctica]